MQGNPSELLISRPEAPSAEDANKQVLKGHEIPEMNARLLDKQKQQHLSVS